MQIIDLTHPVRDGAPGVSVRTTKTIEREGWNASTLELYSHSGTHMDAPFHFLPGGAKLDSLDLGQCIGRCWKADLSPAEPRQLIGADDLERCCGGFEPGDRLVVGTGWADRAGTPDFRDALPRISADGARWIAGRGVALVGVEPPSVADVNNIEEVTEIHRILLSAGVVIAEALCNVDRLPADRPFQLIALPLKVEGGDGAPARVVAVVDGPGDRDGAEA